jgi:hypothetical protein
VSARIVARSRRQAVIASAAALALGLAACGKTNAPSSAENDGVYVNAGPVTYQLQISRELNQYSTEDSQYVHGLPAGTSTTPPSGKLWYGVFLWAKNQTDHTHPTASRFDIIDTQGNVYYPEALNPSINPYTWTSRYLAPGAIQPGPDTTASFGPTQGGLLLFELPSTVYDNRPLMLRIYPPAGGPYASISLDL